MKKSLKEESKKISEGKMVQGFWVIHSGLGGVIRREFAKDLRLVNMIIRDWAESSLFDEGETIKIKKGQSEY